jgi:holin-like protein
MIIGLTHILIFQGLGELLSKFLFPGIPGPVIGLVLLLGFLLLKKEVSKELGLVSDAFTQHLGLLFIPAAVGAILYLPSLRANGLAIALALLGSLVVSFAVSVLIMKLLDKEKA